LFEIDPTLTDNASTSVTIADFNANDLVQFFGFDNADISAAVNTAVYSGANEVLTLPDGSTVTFDGVGPGGVPLSNLLGSSSGLAGSPDLAFSPGDTLINGTTPYGTGTFVTAAYGMFMGGPNNTFTGGAAGQFTITGDLATLGYKYIDLVGDALIGGTGASTLAGGAGSYTFVGGVGDTADYTAIVTAGIVAIIQGGGGTVNKGGANGSNTLAGVPNLVDNGTGRSNGDVFYVDGGENVTANSSNFNYLIELSAGVDLAYGTNFTGIAEFVSNVGTNTVNFASDTNFAYVYGSTGNDTLTLGAGGGYLIGEGGTNILNGGANATNLFVGGSGGTDTMNGGTGSASNFYFVDGNDQVNGAGAFNVMVELVSGVTVQLGSAQYQHVQEFVGNSGNNVVTVANTDADFVYLYGGTGNDTLSTRSGGGYLFGEGGTNVLSGGAGTNVFVADGGAGVDTMNGGGGSNIYYIDNNSTVHGAGTFNTVEELQQNASLVLGSAQLGTDVQQAVFSSGTNSADFHTATSSVYLYGGSGNDTLFGGTGNDFLYGGTGTNTFKFAAGWGHDTIEDWTAGTNSQIDLTALSGLGVHAITDLMQTITGGNDVITSGHTGTNSITLLGVGAALTAGSFHFA
jgi:Ca2+-binding RTX toxin-like protein